MAYSMSVTFAMPVSVPENDGADLVGVGDTLVSVAVGPLSMTMLALYTPSGLGIVSTALVVPFLMVAPLSWNDDTSNREECRPPRCS